MHIKGTPMRIYFRSFYISAFVNIYFLEREVQSARETKNFDIDQFDKVKQREINDVLVKFLFYAIRTSIAIHLKLKRVEM